MNLIKRLFFVFLATVFSSPGHSQAQEVKWLLDTVIHVMKNHAVNAAEVSWDTITTKAHEKAKGITDPYELGPVMRYLYQSINDYHGGFFYRDSFFKWQRETKKVPDSFMNEWKKGVQSITMVLDKNIGYLRIPSMPISDNQQSNSKAQQLNDSLCVLLNKNVKGLILDLRLNGGGAMHPMILGVKQLIDSGHIGSFQVKKTENWYIREDGFYVDTSLISKINPTCKVEGRNIPVVMLISPYTGSAAECFLIAFTGRKNTVRLGSASAGYTSVNTGIPINQMAFMNLAVGYSADKNGKLYKDALPPDILFAAIDKFNDIPNDEKVKAAVRWLKGKIRN